MILLYDQTHLRAGIYSTIAGVTLLIQIMVLGYFVREVIESIKRQIEEDREEFDFVHISYDRVREKIENLTFIYKTLAFCFLYVGMYQLCRYFATYQYILTDHSVLGDSSDYPKSITDRTKNNVYEPTYNAVTSLMYLNSVLEIFQIFAQFIIW